MPINDEARQGGELIGDENCPWLHLETGQPDCNRALATLEPGHKCYGLFAWAREQQDSWSLDTHRGFWLAMVHLWPGTRGNPAGAETLGYAFRAAQRKGVSDADAARALGYSLESLKTMLGRRTREPVPFGKIVSTAYPLPRVHADVDDEPDPGAYCSLAPHELPSAGRSAGHRVRQLRAGIDSVL